MPDTPNISERHYDVVVVGGGVAGAVLAKVLAELAYRDGKSVSILILEAGTGVAGGDVAHDAYLQGYYAALIKTPNSPYPVSTNAPSPEDLAFLKAPDDRYLVQRGPLTFGSNNLRMLGGTTHHWMGISLRMLPTDFRMMDEYGVGVNWPISYDDLRPYYEKAEWELGVAANVADQRKIYDDGANDYGEGYEYPMLRVPVSYLDRVLSERIGNDFKFQMADESYPVRLVSIPQARNSVPRGPAEASDPRDYIAVARRGQSRPYQPSGAPEDLTTGAGQRCEGNASCIPICPSRAKYNALKTIEELMQLARLPGIHVDIVTKAVASEVIVGTDGKVSSIEYLNYDDSNASYATTRRTTGRRFVLAGSAIENAKLLLASRHDDKVVANSSDCVGRHLMDHPFILSWGLMPETAPVDGMRGPPVTSDLPMRHGGFRRKHSAFRTDVSNAGWGLADGAPYTDLERMIDPQSYKGKYPSETIDEIVPRDPLHGEALRARMRSQLRRQIMLGFLMEQLPDPDNRVTIDASHRDALGLCKPVIRYDIGEYTRAGMAEAYRFASTFYARVGAIEFTDHAAQLGDKVIVGSQTFKYIGAGHIMGTHRMGNSAADSVVNSFQQSWDHPNLYVVGCGSMPTVGTSNPTLTATALSIRSAEHIFHNLELAER
ncbi:GMC oxidoreductase [Novosphingobium sp.]|uniref:GMC oxidoreductase n=1 Tax=Novosphingobium sp. TaxID=1874826 RepID=UPI003B52616A